MDTEEAAAPAAVIFRMKGLLNIAGSAKQHVLQAVGQLYEVSPAGLWPASATRVSRVVVIGKGMDMHALQVQLTACEAQIESGVH